jgi:mannose-6-phosphate isomerase
MHHRTIVLSPGSARLDLPPMVVQRIRKPWGFELIWAHTAHYAGKILSIRRGCQLSLQFHERKDESIYVLSGAMEIELEGEDGCITCYQARRGASVHVPARRRHRLRALTACRVLEVSTPELDDIVRLRDDYGRAIARGPGQN